MINLPLKKCAVCGKEFVPTYNWIYRINSKFYCCYSHYTKAGGDGGRKRLKREGKYDLYRDL